MLFPLYADSQFSPEKKILLNSKKQNSSSSELSLLTENIGGPSSVGAQILGDARIMKEEQFRFPKFDQWISPWFSWKKTIRERYDFDLGADNSFLYQHSNLSLTNMKNAAGNIFRLFAKWGLVNRNTLDRGSLIFKVETRNRLFTSIPPQELSDQIGYEGSTAASFTETGLIVNSFYWEQFFNRGNLGLAIGRLVPADFVDIAGYANSFTTFQNLLVLSDPSIAIPDTGIGFLTEINMNSHWFILTGLYDANGSKNKVGFFNEDFELFSHLEIGWSLSRENRSLRDVHIIAWRMDADKKHGEPQSYGIGLSTNWVFYHSLMPFLRIGCSSGPAPFMKKSFTSGVMYLLPNRCDLVGIGLNIGKTNVNHDAVQYTSEVFYRFQFSKIIAMTPSVQWLLHPALNPRHNSVIVFGIRIRFAF